VRRLGWLVVGLGLLAGCSATSGLVHRVQPGENLYRIGKAYGVSHQELARANGIADPDRIVVGQVIRIPGADREVPVDVITPSSAKADKPALPEIPSGPKAFVWPVEGAVLESGFGPRGDSHHDGVDLSAPEGTPILAARAGRVLYADTLRGYGNIVIVEHGDGWATVYAHNRENRVAVGSTVRQGDVVALLGATGKTTGPNLHFEIRKDNVARNPLFFLPPVRSAKIRSTTAGRGDRDS
jgi:murein DD-endopeptidase MepM/ murein hydrolase activator NlpD